MKIDSSGHQGKFSGKKIQNRLDKTKKNENQKWKRKLNLPATMPNITRSLMDHQRTLPQITSGCELQVNIFDKEFHKVFNIVAAVLDMKFC